MPTVHAIAKHHDRPKGQCWRCDAPHRTLDRAHLIDRCRDGLDGPQNLALLCSMCHTLMPSFGPGDENAARCYAMPDHPGLSRYVERLFEVAGISPEAS